MIDVLRLRINGFRHQEFTHELLSSPKARSVAERLIDLDGQARKLPSKNDIGSFLNDEYNKIRIPPLLQKELCRRLRQDTKVVLCGRETSPFGLGSALLNRFAVFLLFKYDQERLSYYCSDIDESRVHRNANGEYEVLLGRKMERHKFDRIVISLGASPALDESFPEIASLCRAGTSSGDDPTRWPLYPSNFFPDRPSWRWPEFKDLRVSQTRDAYGLHPMDRLDFVKLASLCQTVDKKTMRSIRGLNQSFFSERELADQHRTLIDAHLNQSCDGIGLKEFFERLHDELTFA